MTSFYSLFGTTRDILKKSGPSIASPTNPKDTTLGHIAVAVLNKVIRPLLAKWHPILKDYEDRKPSKRTAAEHEWKWKHSAELREQITKVQKQLIDYADVLAEVSGVSKLH